MARLKKDRDRLRDEEEEGEKSKGQSRREKKRKIKKKRENLRGEENDERKEGKMKGVARRRRPVLRLQTDFRPRQRSRKRSRLFRPRCRLFYPFTPGGVWEWQVHTQGVGFLYIPYKRWRSVSEQGWLVRAKKKKYRAKRIVRDASIDAQPLYLFLSIRRRWKSLANFTLSLFISNTFSVSFALTTIFRRRAFLREKQKQASSSHETATGVRNISPVLICRSLFTAR